MSILSGLLGGLTQGMWSDAQRLLQDRLVAGVFNSVTNSIFQETVYDAVTQVNWLNKIQERGDPMLNIHWSVVMPFGLPPMYIEEASIPIFETVDTNPVQFGNRKRIDPGFVSVDNLELTFTDSTSGVVMAFLQQWRSLVEYMGYYGRPADYKKTITVLLHDSKGTVVMVFTFGNCWPISAGNLSLVSGSADAVKYPVQFSVERMRVEVVGQTSVARVLSDVGTSLSDQLRNRLEYNARSMLSNGIRTIGNSILNSIF